MKAPAIAAVRLLPELVSAAKVPQPLTFKDDNSVPQPMGDCLVDCCGGGNTSLV